MAPCGGTISRELNQSKIHMQSSDTSTKDQVQDPITSASVDSSSERAYKTIVRSHDKLVTALSNDIITMSGILLAKEFISAEISSKMLLPNYIPQEKATILVNAVIDKIKIAPNRFDELIKIFSEQTCTKDVISSLASQVRHVHEQGDEDDTQDCGTEVISNGQQYTVCEGHMYTAWVSLNPADKIDLEARLIDDAEAIREEFALLCWRVRDSFEQRGIRPLTLASALLDLTISEESSNGNSGIPLLKQKEEALMSAKSVHDIFHVLRPHMNFFNYEILQFLIKGKGSKEDKTALSVFLKKFEKFCKRHVFEVPFTVYSNGQSSDNPIVEQRFHVKVTRLFKAALLTQVASKSVLIANDGTQVEKICSNKLGVNLEDAKNIQRKFAKILKLKPSSLFLDCISEGSVILTFLLPMCVSLAGLDHNPEIVPLSSNGIVILCGPPDKPERKELIPNGITVGWSPPEYGCDSLRQYVVYYRMKCEHETSEWQKIELSSLETHACVPNLSDGNTYVFKICTVSDVGTLQYSNESDPIILYNSEISVKDIYTVITTVTTTCHEMITLALSLADTHKVATSLLAKKIKHGAVMTFDSKPSDQTMISSPRIHTIIKSEPEKFREFLSILSESPLESVVEAIQSVFYRSVCSQYAGCLNSCMQASIVNIHLLIIGPLQSRRNFLD